MLAIRTSARRSITFIIHQRAPLCMGRINFTTTTPVAGGATPPLPPFTRIPTSVQKVKPKSSLSFLPKPIL